MVAFIIVDVGSFLVLGGCVHICIFISDCQCGWYAGADCLVDVHALLPLSAIALFGRNAYGSVQDLGATVLVNMSSTKLLNLDNT